MTYFTSSSLLTEKWSWRKDDGDEWHELMEPCNKKLTVDQELTLVFAEVRGQANLNSLNC